jgi:drug/metabolite transporter (DMT)-like permease
MNKKMSKKSKIVFTNFAMLITAIIWGSTFIVIKNNLVGVHAVTMVCYRFALAALLMWVILVFLRKKPWQHLTSGLILGLLLFASYVTQALALYYMMVVDGGFIAGMFVIFVPLLSIICGREKLRLNIVIAIVLAGIGLWNVTGGIANFKWSNSLMLLSAMVFALHILYADLVVKKCDILVLNFQQFLVTALASFFSILLFDLPFTVAAWNNIWWILYLALFANILCYLIQFSAQKTISPTVCALIFSSEPLFVAIFAWTVGNEKIIMADIIGGVMIVAAIICAQIYRKNDISQSDRKKL